MKPRTFPFDQQECEFDVRLLGYVTATRSTSWGGTTHTLQFSSSYQPNPEFDLVEVRTAAVDTFTGAVRSPTRY